MRYARFTLALTLIFPSVLAGQSVLGSSGLGMRLEPLDAVERALGGLGVTNSRATVLPGNPVASLDVLAPTIAFTIQPHWGKFTVGSEKGNFIGTRFPVLGLAYPLGTDGVITLTAGSQFDQNWSVVSKDSVLTGGESLGVTDTFISDGSIAVVQAGWARYVTSAFAVGATLGVYRGGLTRAFRRTFDQLEPDSVTLVSPIEPFGIGGRWTHSGPMGSLTVAWDPSSALQVGATLGWGGKVKVVPADEAEDIRREVSIPLEFKVSTTAVLNPGLSLNVGVSSSNWTDLGDPSVDAAAAGRVMSYGAGVEWEATRFWAGTLPLRFGIRRSVMPFRFSGKKVRERTISFGFSVVMAEALGLPVAAMDVAFETGNRHSGDFQESLRRITVSTRVGGF